MHNEQTVQRFIELRAQGWPYTRIMAELNVAKNTLVAWSRKHRCQIQNQKAIELDALRDKWLATVTARVDCLGEQLRKMETELARRDPAALSTYQLHALTRSLRHQIERATAPVEFSTPVGELPDEECPEEVPAGLG